MHNYPSIIPFAYTCNKDRPRYYMLQSNYMYRRLCLSFSQHFKHKMNEFPFYVTLARWGGLGKCPKMFSSSPFRKHSNRVIIAEPRKVRAFIICLLFVKRLLMTIKTYRCLKRGYHSARYLDLFKLIAVTTVTLF